MKLLVAHGADPNIPTDRATDSGAPRRRGRPPAGAGGPVAPTA
jgi:hypothetical protein